MILLATNALTGNVINHTSSEIAPLMVSFNVTGQFTNIARYQWDMNNNGNIDQVTYDNFAGCFGGCYPDSYS